VGHGTLAAEDLRRLLAAAGIDTVVDVRSFPGSRRHPHFGRDQLEAWLPAAGIEYRWEKDLGGFRKPAPDSPNQALRHPSFRGYADHMASAAFGTALDRLIDLAGRRRTAVMCSESLWWRCHRRLLSDALVLWRGAAVTHLAHDGRRQAHRLTDGVRPGDGGGPPVYDVGVTPPLPAAEG